MDKYNKCCMEVWGDQGQYFYGDRKPNDVERFLQLYIGKDNIRLCKSPDMRISVTAFRIGSSLIKKYNLLN